MDEYNPHPLPPEHSLPSWESEYSPPSWGSERNDLSPKDEVRPVAPEETAVAPEESTSAGSAESKPSFGRRIRQIARYVAAVAITGAIVVSGITEPPPEPEPEPEPKEIVEVESYIEIECCAVMPEEPEVLRFRYMDYRSVYDEVPTYSDDDFRFYLVDADGQETELARWKDAVLYRPVYCAEDEDVRVATYSAVETEGTYFNLNTGCEMWCADIGGYRPGLTLKIVCEYETDEAIVRMTSTREVVLLPTQPEITVRVDLLSAYAEADSLVFDAIMHPTEGGPEAYVFGEHAFARMSFCTRWYDANGEFLGEGLCFATPNDLEWPFPDAYLLSSGDYEFKYTGFVRKAATNPDAVYYSLELMIVEESTGWPYLFETELIPIHSSVTEIPSSALTPDEERVILLESGKDEFDWMFRFPEADWVVTKSADSWILANPNSSERLMLYSVLTSADEPFTTNDLDTMLWYRYQQEQKSGVGTVQNPDGPYDYYVNGYAGRVLEFEINTGAAVYRCRNLFWGVDNRMYMITLLAVGTDFDHAVTVENEMLATFTPADASTTGKDLGALMQ